MYGGSFRADADAVADEEADECWVGEAREPATRSRAAAATSSFVLPAFIAFVAAASDS